MAGMGDGLLTVVLAWGTIGVIRPGYVVLPTDEERFAGTDSTRFLPNY